MDQFSYLSNADPAVLDDLYNNYLQNPTSVDETWSKFFEGIAFATQHYPNKPATSAGEIPENVSKEFKVINLINGYRSRGHLFTKTNPVR
jgi:2-oxoglutarate dehydrogenase E1 component